MTFALAGRRIDSKDTELSSFPLESVPFVRNKLRALLLNSRPAAIVSSAACGADLLALEVAGQLGIRRRVILPFESACFRESSVLDRPGDWGPVYDAVLNEVSSSDDLIILNLPPEEDKSYALTNRRILDEARAIADASEGSVSAVLVWDQRPRGSGDLTAAFETEARARNFPVLTVSTLACSSGELARG